MTLPTRHMTSETLVTFMNHHGISKHEFAAILGVTYQSVALWVEGKRTLSITNSRLIRLFNKFPMMLKEFDK